MKSTAINWSPNSKTCHVRVISRQRLSSLVNALDLSLELIPFGAVYLNKQRQISDIDLAPHDYVRIHASPRRYSTDYDWSKRLLIENKDFIVVDKPSGLPVPPTLDNYAENARVLLERHLATPLFVTHRLDVPTGGLLLLARSKSFQTYFNQLLASGRVNKEYAAFTKKQLVLGSVVHYMKASKFVPKSVSTVPDPSAKRCELVVNDSDKDSKYWKSKITLLTGRTHQIRAQLAALGAPIVGDTQYGGIACGGKFGLFCERLQFRMPDGNSLAIQRPSDRTDGPLA